MAFRERPLPRGKDLTLERLLTKDLITAVGISGALMIVAMGLVVGALAFLGKWMFAELSAHNKVRRDFAAATGTRIAELANNHYWAIANAAGTLSVDLRGYLQKVEIQLYVVWFSREQIRETVAQVTTKAAPATFPSLVQLLWELHRFQFMGSNDYLLPHHSAGTHLRRLYNGFRESLTSAKTADGDDLATAVLQNGKKDKDGKLDLEATLHTASFESKQKNGLDDPNMQRLREGWTVWLNDYLPDVLNATTSLEAFSRLLQEQIAALHEDWFRDNRPADELDAVRHAVKRKAWFGILTPSELATLVVACEQADFMTSLRRTASGLPPSRAEVPRDLLARDDKPPHDEPIKTAGVGLAPHDEPIETESRSSPGRDAMEKASKASRDPNVKFVDPQASASHFRPGWQSRADGARV